LVIVALLDGGCNGSPDSNTVTSHHCRLFIPVGIQEDRFHRLGVFCSQEKNLPNLNSSRKGKRLLAYATAVALLGKSKVGQHLGLEIQRIVHVDPVVTGFVCPGYTVLNPSDAVICNHRPSLANRADLALRQSSQILGKLSLHHAQRTLELGQRKNPVATNNGEVGPSFCLDKQGF
jgi:hypothetical protein